MYKKLNNTGFGVVWIIVAIALVLVVGIVGYRSYAGRSDDSKADTNQQQPAVAENTQAPTGTVITTGDSQYGPMLFNEAGQAIYIWEVEKSPTAECYGDCADEWPPVLTDGAPRAAGSVNAGLLGTTTRTDGSTQVTYNSHPLYYYAHEKAGEVKCHNITTHGGLWWVIQPNGVRAS